MSHFYNFSSHIYHVIADGRFIFLDAKHDRYVFVDKNNMDIFLEALCVPDFTGQDEPVIAAAIQKKVVVPAAQPQRLNEIAAMPQGIGLHRWNLPEESSLRLAWTEALPILKTYVAIRFSMRSQGLQTVLQKVAAHLRSTNKTRVCDKAETEDICRKIRQAGLYLPFRTACLECALVSAVLLSRRSIPVELRIGIQLDPFLAHAWINVDGQVMLDKPDLNQSMIPLVVIP